MHNAFRVGGWEGESTAEEWNLTSAAGNKPFTFTKSECDCPGHTCYDVTWDLLFMFLLSGGLLEMLRQQGAARIRRQQDQ